MVRFRERNWLNLVPEFENKSSVVKKKGRKFGGKNYVNWNEQRF